MREIKLRAYRIHKHSKADMDYSKRWVLLSEFLGSIETNYPEAILMQYTGFKDELDVEVYEGDIIERDGYRGAVIFEEGTYYIDNQDEENMYITFLFPQYSENKGKVMGNIYQHPELLKNI